MKLATGYDWRIPNGLVVTPSVSMQETHLSADSRTTHGGGVVDLHVNGSELDIVQGRLGARLAYPYKATGGYLMTPEVHAYYLHNFGSRRIAMTSNFTGGGPTFTTTGPTWDQNIFNVGVGLTLGQVGRTTFSGAYDYTGGGTSHDHTFFFRLTTAF